MQNPPNAQTPPGGTYGAPTPAKKPGLSKGCLIGIIAAVVLVVVGLVVLLAAAGGLYYFNRQDTALRRARSTARWTRCAGSSSAA